MKTILGAALALSFVAAPLMAQSKDTNKDAYCKSVSELDDSLDSLNDVSKTAPMSELRARFDAVKEDLARVSREAEIVSQDAREKLRSARAELIKAIQAIPDNVTVERGKQMVEPQIKELKKARENYKKSTSCD